MGRTKVPLLIARQTDTLFDDFRDERAAGTMNGTLATDGRNARTDNDTEGKLTHAGGLLVCSGGKASPAYGDPARWYPAVTREVGRMILWRQLTIADVTARIELGVDTAASGGISENTFRFTVDTLIFLDGGVQVSTGPVPTDATAYDLLMILRAIGVLYYWRLSGSGPFTLLWPSTSRNNSPVYPGVSNYSTAFTLDHIRVPTRLWMPTPRLSHGFTALSPSDGAGHAETTGLGAGGAGVTLTGATWSVAGGKATNAPVAGDEKCTDTGFDNAGSWSAGTGWSVGGSVATKVPGVTSGITQNVATIGIWYQIQFDVKSITAGLFIPIVGGEAIYPTRTIVADGYKAVSLAATAEMGVRGSSTTNGTVDNASVKPLTLSELFLLPQTAMPDANVVASADLTVVAGFPTGIALVNSTTNPTAGLTITHNGTNLVCRKFTTATTWTTLVDAAAAYSANAAIRFSYNSVTGALRCYYNSVLIGTEQTVTDAEIVACRYVTGFDTGGGGSVDNIVVSDLFVTVPGL